MKLQEIQQSDVHIDYDTNEPSILFGWAKLTEEIIYHAINSGKLRTPSKKKSKNKFHYERKKKDALLSWEKNKRRNISFALNSPIVEHFCDAYNWDVGRVRRKILTANGFV